MHINPQEPCSTAYDYFTAEEKRHLEAFTALDLQPDRIYTNAAGERRIVRRIFFPYGWQTPLTVYGQHIQKGSPYRYFHTPLATISEHREGEVLYEDEAKKSVKVKSSEFLAWLGAEYGTEAVVSTEKPTKVPMGIIKAHEENTQNFAKIDEARADDKEEKPDWQPVAKRNKSSKKS